MKSEYVNAARAVVGDPNILINLIFRRVRQLNAGGGGIGRPLVTPTDNQGMADVALREIIEGRMGWVLPEVAPVTRLVNRKRKRS